MDLLEARGVFIEWTRSSVLGAIERYPELFEYKGTAVSWRGPEDRKGVLARYWEGRFSDSFMTDLVSAVRKASATTISEQVAKN